LLGWLCDGGSPLDGPPLDVPLDGTLDVPLDGPLGELLSLGVDDPLDDPLDPGLELLELGDDDPELDGELLPPEELADPLDVPLLTAELCEAELALLPSARTPATPLPWERDVDWLMAHVDVDAAGSLGSSSGNNGVAFQVTAPGVADPDVEPGRQWHSPKATTSNSLLSAHRLAQPQAYLGASPVFL
jgi:hypothetical protein